MCQAASILWLSMDCSSQPSLLVNIIEQVEPQDRASGLQTAS